MARLKINCSVNQLCQAKLGPTALHNKKDRWASTFDVNTSQAHEPDLTVFHALLPAGIDGIISYVGEAGDMSTNRSLKKKPTFRGCHQNREIFQCIGVKVPMSSAEKKSKLQKDKKQAKRNGTGEDRMTFL